MPAAEVFGDGWEYVGLAIGVVLIVANMTLLNRAVEAAPASLALPLYQCLNVNVAILAGGLYFGEFDQLSTVRLASTPPKPHLHLHTCRYILSPVPRRQPGEVAGFVLGLVISFAGVMWLGALAKPNPEVAPVHGHARLVEDGAPTNGGKL